MLQNRGLVKWIHFFLGPWLVVCQFIEISNQMESNGKVLNLEQFFYIIQKGGLTPVPLTLLVIRVVLLHTLYGLYKGFWALLYALLDISKVAMKLKYFAANCEYEKKLHSENLLVMTFGFDFCNWQRCNLA